MNGSTSGTQALQGRKVNHDPKPYQVYAEGVPIGRRINHQEPYMNAFAADISDTYAPRPEFDVRDNPILTDFRCCTGTVPENARWWLTLLDGDVYDWRPVSAEQIDHARRVLTKLAALA